MTTHFPTAKEADIALLLEGTYPYVQGGVSSWVHALIQGFPEYRFAVVFLGSEPSAYKDVQYKFPPNLVHLEAHFLQDRSRRPTPTQAPAVKRGVFDDVKAMHEGFLAPHEHAHGHGASPHGHEGHSHAAAAGGDAFAATVGHLMSGLLSEPQFMASREAWEMMTTLYQERCTDPSFVDYFWTVRSMHEPIWTLARIARGLIPARCYHSVSTGYAGFLGSLLTHGREKPFILSEHGLYTKERKIDLFHSPWIREAENPLDGQASEGNYIRNLWIRFFEVLGKSAYASANPIVSLYDGIRKRQIEDGAAEDRTFCIPNGISLDRFAPLRDVQTLPCKPVFALIGRVVPIKDIKTFIRAMHTVCNRIPGAQAWIVGPGEEDPRYFQECVTLTETLGLAGDVHFLGYREVGEILPEVAMLVLSSISEALPLTLLEGFAAGVPAVATDVGSCRQLINGREGDAEDVGFGKAGRLVAIGDPTALAEAMVGLYSDQDEWFRARDAGMARVEKFYTEKRMLASYGEIYSGILG